MKKVLYRIWGICVLIACGFSAAMMVIIDAAIVLRVVFFKNLPEEDKSVVFLAILSLPVLIYFLWAWQQPWSVEKIKRYLHGKTE